MDQTTNSERLLDILVEYSRIQHEADLIEILLSTQEERHYSVTIDGLTLFEASWEIWNNLLTDPLTTLTTFDSALIQAANLIFDENQRKNEMKQKQNIHARITSLPVCPQLTRFTAPRAKDSGSFLCVTGTVIRTTSVKLLEFEKGYVCRKCKQEFTVKADIEQFYRAPKPEWCKNSDCASTYFTPTAATGSVLRDYQEITIQEQVHNLSIGKIPRSIPVVLEDDLVNICKAGDDVVISGVVMRRWGHLIPGERPQIELFLKANHIRVNNDQQSQISLKDDLRREFELFWDKYKNEPLNGRNLILSNFCPQIYGLYMVKLAVAMVLAGGVNRIDPSGTRIRGESHLLLVGDPGTGKSQFLKYAAKVCPRCVLTTGIGSTSAGLTVTAIKDGGEWQLEAGALVLADGGICCIDEFNSITEKDKTTLHEAMEQQTISVAKAGLVCKLNTRCTILAATNPKGSYDPSEPLNVNIGLASPLLSRFDLILVLLDQANETWDKMVSGFVLEGREPIIDSSNGSNRGDVWNLEKMRSYFCLIRTRNPVLTDTANLILRRYYQCQRQADSRNAARTTVRLLESLIRLAQGHARLMFRNEVTTQDAVVAISVMEISMNKTQLFNNANVLHTVFPEDAEREYRDHVEIILRELKLEDLLQNEIENLDKSKSNTSELEESHDISQNNVEIIEENVISTRDKLKNFLFSDKSTSTTSKRKRND